MNAAKTNPVHPAAVGHGPLGRAAAAGVLALLGLATAPGTAATPGPAMVRDSDASITMARGVVRAVSEATLTSRLSARINALPFADGASFSKGDRLVEFDCERPKAEHRAATAVAAAQRKQVETNEELDRFNAVGKNELLVSQSQLDKALAEVDAMAATLTACQIDAPFNGRVVTRLARQHEAVQAGAPLLKIVDTSANEVDLIVPSQWLAWMATGTPFVFRVDETGASLKARVQRVSPSVDAVSRTVRIVATFDDPKAKVLPGMSGTATAWKRTK